MSGRRRLVFRLAGTVLALVAAVAFSVSLPAVTAKAGRVRSVTSTTLELEQLQAQLSAMSAARQAASDRLATGQERLDSLIGTLNLQAHQLKTQRERLRNAEAHRRPNVVVIVTDDQRWDTLWAMPNVRHLLADHGVTFTNAFVTTPLCCPARTSIFTGRYSRHTGVLDNLPPNGGAPAFDDRSTVATWLHDAGYSTSMVGKYLNAYVELPRGYQAPGWDDWHAIYQQPQPKFYNYTLVENGSLVTYGSDPSDYLGTVLTERAVRFVHEAPADKPFLLYLATPAPHLPATPAPGDQTKFADLASLIAPSVDEADLSDKPWAAGGDYPRLASKDLARFQTNRRTMIQCLAAVDSEVADVVHAVDERGQLDNTVFLFTSDNGFLYGEHRLGGKIWPYEESIRVPLVVRAPWIETPRKDAHLVTNLDFAPTLAQLALTEPGRPVDGLSLLPLLQAAPPGSAAWRHAFVVEYLGDREGGRHSPASTYSAIRSDRYLYVAYLNGWRELYDLQVDPYELVNRAVDPAYAGVRTGLSALLSRLIQT